MPDTLREKVAMFVVQAMDGKRGSSSATDAIMQAVEEDRAALMADFTQERQYREGVVNDLAKAEAREAALVAVLKKYGQHIGDCDADLSYGDDVYPCICGLADALAGAKGETP